MIEGAGNRVQRGRQYVGGKDSRGAAMRQGEPSHRRPIGVVASDQTARQPAAARRAAAVDDIGAKATEGDDVSAAEATGRSAVASSSSSAESGPAVIAAVGLRCCGGPAIRRQTARRTRDRTAGRSTAPRPRRCCDSARSRRDGGVDDEPESPDQRHVATIESQGGRPRFAGRHRKPFDQAGRAPQRDGEHAGCGEAHQDGIGARCERGVDHANPTKRRLSAPAPGASHRRRTRPGRGVRRR